MTDDALTPEEASPGEPPDEAIDRAFGEENRSRLLNRYFAGTPAVEPGRAWTDVYRLLLWVDRTIGLAHCYESDKCQPGKPWYARSLTFHGWVAERLGTPPADLKDEIDWLFRHASADLAKLVVAVTRSAKVTAQRAPYEGFEDTLAAVLQRIPGITRAYSIKVRAMLHDVPGFSPGPANEKPRQVDLVLVRKSDQRRILITAKWSIRADREEQFMSDFRDYSRFENLGQDFDYVLVTNEFDAARLVRACERRRENASLFTDVVHVNPEGPVVVYGGQAAKHARWKAADMVRYVEQKRLSSLEDWLAALLTHG